MKFALQLNFVGVRVKMMFLEDREDDGQTKRSEKSITFVGISKA